MPHFCKAYLCPLRLENQNYVSCPIIFLQQIRRLSEQCKISTGKTSLPLERKVRTTYAIEQKKYDVSSFGWQERFFVLNRPYLKWIHIFGLDPCELNSLQPKTIESFHKKKG